MQRYVLRRILQTVPTVLGVILIIFVLFNVVGQSPALMVLGNKATAESLEEFDEVRGFNKPLLFGRRTVTRAYESIDFSQGIGAWRSIPGASHDPDASALVLAEGRTYTPLAFALRPHIEYEWKIEFELEEGANAVFFGHPLLAGGQHAERIRVNADSPASITVQGDALRILKLELYRRVKNPFDSQLFFYLGQLARGDLGDSTYFRQPVIQVLKEGIGPTLALTVPILVIGVVVSVCLALVCAFFRDTWVDRFLVIISVALMSINYLVFIVAGQYGLGYRLGWFPVWGFESWRYLALPVLVGVVSGLGANVRFYRTIMLDEMYKDYVRTAFAKGVSKPRVLFVHVLKNAMIPIITNVAIAIPFLYTGSLLLESFFGIPGLGYLSVNAINSSDVDVVRAVVLVGALLYVGANLLTDLCYVLVDPRVKLK
jgi:peptide/nickel transport system permease protein